MERRLGRVLVVGFAVASLVPSPSAPAAIAPGGTWVAGDTHVHTDHSSDGSSIRQGISQGAPGNVSVADQIGQAERTVLGFLPLTDHRTYDQHWDPGWTSDKLILIPGEEANGSPHANVFGAADELVDGANPPASAAYRHVQQSIWDVHAQNGAWQVNHPEDGEMAGGKPNANASAVGVDLVEAWNRGSDPDLEIDYIENRLNAGFRFGLAGASDNHFRELWGLAGPGQPTTHVFAPTATERGVVAGMRAGHTSVSFRRLGPRVTLTADVDGDGRYEAMGGDEVTAIPGAAAKLKVRVLRGAGTKAIVYAAPGRARGAIATFRVTKPDQSFTLPLSPAAAWYRVEVRGVGAPPGLAVDRYQPDDALLALASPLFVDQGARADPHPEVPLPPLISATDNAVAVLDSRGVFTGFGDIAATPTAAHVVAEVDADGRASVVYRRMTADGSRTTSTAERLSDLPAAARFPSVAAVGNDVWVAWQEDRGDQKPHRTNIVVRHSADSGATWDKASRVTTTGHAQHPTVEATRDRHPVVAWSDNTRGAFDVYVRDLVADKAATNVSTRGKRVRAGTPADSRSAVYPASVFPSLTVANDRRLAVAWADNRRDIDPGWTGSRAGEGTAPDDWEVFTATRAPGAAWGSPVNASNDAKRADRHPSIAFTGNQQALIVAWDSKELQESDVNLDVRYAQAAPVGNTWTPARRVGFDANAMSQHPQVVAAGPGAGVVWYDSRSADWRWSIWAATLDTSGSGAPVRLTGAGNATYPSASGNLVAFTSDRQATRPQRDPTHGVFVRPLA